jgi:MerR family transcriptional regulator, thiopeptide resistance regulator
MAAFKAKQTTPECISSNSVTIGQLAKRFGLSRSTLLYYDSIGLLKPSARNWTNYRRYSQKDTERLEMICMYRQTGLSMAEIGEILNSPKSNVHNIMEKRLLALTGEISRLREQQHMIIRMMGDRSFRTPIPVLDKESWIALLRAVGLDDDAMLKWHQEFEKLSPQLHQEFLEGLGISGEEIDVIRQWSQT